MGKPGIVLICSVQEESKTNAGSVEAIQEHPEDSNKVSRHDITLLHCLSLCPGGLSYFGGL